MRLNIWLVRLFLAAPVLCAFSVADVAPRAQDNVAVILKRGSLVADDNVAGAGVLVSAEGHVLTAAHVLPMRGIFYLKFKNDSESRAAALIDRLEEHDLALVKTINAENLPSPARLGVSFHIVSEASAESPVHVRGIGHPAIQGVRHFFKEYPSELFGITENLEFIIDHQLYGGDSGGPLFDGNDRVIGIAHTASGAAAGEGLVIPIDYAHPLFEQAGLDSLSETLQSYRTKIETLNQEIRNLKGERVRDKNALNWLLTFLDWDVSFCRTGEDEEAGNALKIGYRKRFKEQATPRDRLSILIVPLFDGHMYEEGQGIVEIDARARFQQNAILIVDELEEQLQRRIERLYEVKPQEEARGKIALDNIDKLRIEIKLESTDPNLSFATVSLERDYVPRRSLHSLLACE